MHPTVSGSGERAFGRGHVFGLTVAAAVGLGALAGSARGQEVPTPESVIGFRPGADHRLASYGQIVSYLQAVDEASDRLLVEEIGRTVEGRPMYLALVSSAANLQHRERYREISRRLARGGDLAPEEARRLAEEGKAIVWIDAGLHATEVAHAQHVPALARHLVTGDDPEVRKIREEAIVLLMPVMNPDGLDIVVDWYRRNRGTRFETTPLPWLYHRYVGHDNNRDWFMMVMPETRAVARQLWHRWYPQIVYNHHQAGEPPPTIFIPPFSDPMNPNIPALVTRNVNLVGTAMGRRFDAEGKAGVVSRETYTMWWNGGMRTAPYFHNQVGILTESYHYPYATPRYFHPDSLDSTFGSGRSTERPSVLYPNPWEGGWWRLADQLEYEFTGSMAVVDVAADLKEQWLFDTYRLAREATEKGGAGDPFAYVVPPEQWDAGAARELLSVLRWNGIEVERATSAFTAGGHRYPAGSYVVFAGQAYRPALLDLMEPQAYPDRREYPGGPPITPYDLAGWTLPMQMGVRTDRIGGSFSAETEPVRGTEVAAPPGRVRGTGDAYLLTPRRNDAFRAVNRLLAAGARVDRALESFDVAGDSWPPGTFVVRAPRDRLASLASELGLDFVAGAPTDLEAARLAAPRVGVYQSWDPSMDEGWTRWILERWEFPYDTLHDADLRRGELSGYDVVVLPRQDADDILNGHAPGTMPEAYTGGMGLEGAANLKRWVEAGGTLVTLDAASEFATRYLGIPVRNAVAGAARSAFFIPGSLIRATVDSRDPLGWGMQDTVAAYFVRSLAFDVIPPAAEENSAEGPRRGERRVDVAVRYAEDDLLMSGWENGAKEHIGGRAAVLRVPVGLGTVVLTGFRTQFRAQPRGTFKILFNALYAGTTEPLPFEPLVEASP